MHSILCTRVVFVICSLQQREELDRARAVARKEHKRNRNKIRKKNHNCKFNLSSTSSASNPGFTSPFCNNHKRCEPPSDSNSDSVYNSDYDIDLGYGYNPDCNRDDDGYYNENNCAEMEYGDDGNRHRNGNWGDWQESTTGVITSMLDTYVTNEDAYVYPYAVYNEDQERGGGSA